MSDPHAEFRRLSPDEDDAGYAVICQTVAWLASKGIELWEKPLPRATYAARHAEGENYGLFGDGSLRAVASIVPGAPPHWRDLVADPTAPWLCTVATATAHRGRGAGRRMIDEAAAMLASRREAAAYLDCTPGFLERYWGSLGFERLAQRRHRIPHASSCGRLFDAVLMRRATRRSDRT